MKTSGLLRFTSVLPAALAFGCMQASPPARSATTSNNVVAAQGPAAVQPPTLPPGWSWPFDVRRATEVLAQATIIRPIDVSRLIPAAGTGPCAPIQVAPFVWTAPDCTNAIRQLLAGSPFVSKRFRGTEQALPNEVDLRRDGLDGPVKNQQMVGVCWAFAISTVMDNSLRRARRADVVAPLHVLSSSVWNDIWSKGRSDSALTAEPNWPYDPVKGCKLNEAKSEIWCGEAYHVKPGSWRSDRDLVAEVARANGTGVHRIRHVATMQVRPADTNQIAGVLAERQAIFATFDYNRTAWSEFGSAGSVIPDYTKTDGGHAVALVGYRTTHERREFLIHNSWGTEWRDGGYAWISEAMVQRHLLDAFTLEVSSTSTTQPVDPMAAPNPVPSSASNCAAGQARDVVLGWCTAKCANGSASAAMLCPVGAGTAAAPRSATCAPGQVRDWLLDTCAPPCGNGLAPMGGACLP